MGLVYMDEFISASAHYLCLGMHSHAGAWEREKMGLVYMDEFISASVHYLRLGMHSHAGAWEREEHFIISGSGAPPRSHALRGNAYLRDEHFSPRSHALRGNAYLRDEHFVSSGRGGPCGRPLPYSPHYYTI